MTSLVWLALVKTKSKNSTEREVELLNPEGHEGTSDEVLVDEHEAVTVELPSQEATKEALQ